MRERRQHEAETEPQPHLWQQRREAKMWRLRDEDKAADEDDEADDAADADDQNDEKKDECDTGAEVDEEDAEEAAEMDEAEAGWGEADATDWPGSTVDDVEDEADSG